MESEIGAKTVPTNPAPAYSNYPARPTDPTYISSPAVPHQGFTPAQPAAVYQQQSLPVQYAGTAPQQQQFFPPQYVTYPGQQGFVPQPMNAAQVVQMPAVSSQYRTAAPIAALGRSPAPVDCPGCEQRSLTITSFLVGNTTHGWAAALCFVFCLGCIPYLLNDCKDVEHKCGKVLITPLELGVCV
ncbi:LITAF-like zinc ribbon domain-containing protein [Thelonectria olida]|uniref:LITAF-like zinc ribbon domain-containing protein n=1 Tax=Thelonectria olida TaxID=1576542 RepID=A0A9P9AHL9_9HYPO|nr:LITAF-like zinc ribbon domain-containing protein [Thelonectria olida]